MVDGGVGYSCRELARVCLGGARARRTLETDDRACADCQSARLSGCSAFVAFHRSGRDIGDLEKMNKRHL